MAGHAQLIPTHACHEVSLLLANMDQAKQSTASLSLLKHIQE